MIQSLGTRLVVLLALSGSLYAAIMPLHDLFSSRRHARKVLNDVVHELQTRLPPANSPDLLNQMPEPYQNITAPLKKAPIIFLREGFVYYPERNAYKYTFLPRYAYDSAGKIETTINPDVPDVLERRSIWLQPDGARWKCYAGVNRTIAIQACHDASIVRGLRKQEHDTADMNAWKKRYNNQNNITNHQQVALSEQETKTANQQTNTTCSNKRIQKSWIWEEMPIYVINNQSAENVYLDIHPTDKVKNLYEHYVILILNNQSAYPTKWYVNDSDWMNVAQLVLLGVPSEVRGLNNQKIIDYQWAIQGCDGTEWESSGFWLHHLERLLSTLPQEHIQYYQVDNQHNQLRLGEKKSEWASSSQSNFSQSSQRNPKTGQLEMKMLPEIYKQIAYECKTESATKTQGAGIYCDVFVGNGKYSEHVYGGKNGKMEWEILARYGVRTLSKEQIYMLSISSPHIKPIQRPSTLDGKPITLPSIWEEGENNE